MKVTGIIVMGEDKQYSIICDEEIGNFCLGGFGETVEAAKADFLEVIEDAKADYIKEHGELADEYKNIEVEYKYNLEAFFTFFDWINISKFAKAAGINEGKMRQYKVGAAVAGEKTRAKIQDTIKRMSAALASVSL